MEEENTSEETFLPLQADTEINGSVKAHEKALMFIDEIMAPFQERAEAEIESHKLTMDTIKKEYEGETNNITSKRDMAMEIAEKISKNLHFVVKNKVAIENLLDKPVEKNSLPIRRELHQEAVSAINKSVDLINSAHEIVDTFAWAANVDLENMLEQLEAKVSQVGNRVLEQKTVLSNIVTLRDNVSRIREQLEMNANCDEDSQSPESKETSFGY